MGLIWTESGVAVRNGSSSLLATKYTAAGSNNASGTGAQVAVGGVLAFDVQSVSLVGADTDDLLVAGLRKRFTTYTATDILTLWGDSNTTQHVTLAIDSTGHLTAWRGPSSTGTLLGTSTNPVIGPLFGTGTWYLFELKVRLSDTVGTVDVHVDDTAVAGLALSGVDTKNAGTGTVFDGVRTIGTGGNTDFYICNEQGSAQTDFLGPIHVLAKVPNGNGTTSNGVGSDGNSTNNYQLVDEASTSLQPDWPVDYVDLSITGDKDTYAFTDITEYPAGNAVKGLMLWTHAEKTDSGARSLTPLARLSTTETSGAVCTLVNGTFVTLGVAYDSKPGGGAWTVNDVNSAEFGASAS